MEIPKIRSRPNAERDEISTDSINEQVANTYEKANGYNKHRSLYCRDRKRSNAKHDNNTHGRWRRRRGGSNVSVAVRARPVCRRRYLSYVSRAIKTNGRPRVSRNSRIRVLLSSVRRRRFSAAVDISSRSSFRPNNAFYVGRTGPRPSSMARPTVVWAFVVVVVIVVGPNCKSGAR